MIPVVMFHVKRPLRAQGQRQDAWSREGRTVRQTGKEQGSKDLVRTPVASLRRLASLPMRAVSQGPSAMRLRGDDTKRMRRLAAVGKNESPRSRGEVMAGRYPATPQSADLCNEERIVRRPKHVPERRSDR
jgi:hypothetical protein